MTTAEELEVRDRSDAGRWPGIEIRGYAEPDLEILPRAKGGDGRTVVGILVPFNKVQRIHDGLTEVIRSGAADHQLAQPRRMKFAHEHIKLGGKLIGRAHETRNDASGLWGALRAAPGVQAADEAIALVEAGALDELSIGFRAVRSRRLPDGVIERVRIDVLETALVLEGAYGRGARVTGLRSQDGYSISSTDEHERAGMTLAELDLAVGARRLSARTVIDLASLR